jgi:hypothetical protein
MTVTTTPTSAWTWEGHCWQDCFSHSSGAWPGRGGAKGFGCLHVENCALSGVPPLEEGTPSNLLYDSAIHASIDGSSRRLRYGAACAHSRSIKAHPIFTRCTCPMWCCKCMCIVQEAVQRRQVVCAEGSGQRQGHQPALRHPQRHNQQRAEVQPGDGQLGSTGHTGRTRGSHVCTCFAALPGCMLAE